MTSLTLQEEQIEERSSRLQDLKQAQAVIQKIAEETQVNITDNIESIVTLALESVFGDELSFKCVFASKRGKTECSFAVVDQQGNSTNPMTAHGGGVLDVVNIGLRLAFWSMEKKRPLVILDEPFKFLSRELLPNAADMLRVMSERLKLQILMVTHIPELINAAERVFSVKKKKGVSLVSQL